MPGVDNKIIKVIVVGNEEAGKTTLMNRLIGKAFNSNYASTMGVDFFLLEKKPIKFHIWDLSGSARFRFIRKAYYQQALGVIYVLDSTKEAEENKRIFQEFNSEIKSAGSIVNGWQLLVFNKSDDENSKLSQDYINEFAIFNVSHVVCSAKTNTGVAEIKDTYFNNVSGLVATKEAEEELLLSEIEKYSKWLSEKNSQIAINKSMALNTIAKACRDRGMGQHQSKASLSAQKIADIKHIISDKKETIRQHRHWFVFNCFFNVIDTVSSSALERRVKSNRLVTELDDYLNNRDAFLKSPFISNPFLKL